MSSHRHVDRVLGEPRQGAEKQLFQRMGHLMGAFDEGLDEQDLLVEEVGRE